MSGELEIKFGTRGIKPITKIKFDNVIQKLLSQNFKFKEESVYYLNINTDTIIVNMSFFFIGYFRGTSVLFMLAGGL